MQIEEEQGACVCACDERVSVVNRRVLAIGGSHVRTEKGSGMTNTM